ncbi:MAG: DUF5320 domain-containing protein [Desulfobacter sp.]
MPGLNHMGPENKGPQTGRGLGDCAGDPADFSRQNFGAGRKFSRQKGGGNGQCRRRMRQGNGGPCLAHRLDRIESELAGLAARFETPAE